MEKAYAENKDILEKETSQGTWARPEEDETSSNQEKSMA